MANPLEIAAVGWGFMVMGWLLSPIFSLLWNKLSAYLAADTSRKLRELEIHTIPSLKQMLRDVVEQRMERITKDKGYASDLMTLEKIENDLRSALNEAEDILDLVDYYRIERKVVGDRSWVWVQHLLSAVGSCITRCKGSWFQRCVERIRAVLLKCVIYVLGEQIPISQRPSNPAVQRIRAWWHSLDIKALCRSMQRWLAKTYAAACYNQDWSYEVVGIKTNQKDGIALDSFRLTIDRKRLRERIEQIEYTVTFSEKSHLLNQQTNSNRSSIEDTSKDSSSTLEEIKVLHRSIPQKVFGRYKERQHICSMFRKGSDAYGPSTSRSKPYHVIGIHGITGSGKSTLALYVCDYEKAEGEHFDPVMFVEVSVNFRMDKIFRDMLREIRKDKDQQSDSNGVTALRDELRGKLKGKRFLLVLDNVWVHDQNQMEWDILLDVLDHGQSGSVILVTAQREDAAAALGAQKQFLIPNLEKNDYLSLFMHHARPGATNDDGEYKRIGRMIANKLHRSPIAAVTVGKQLRRNSRISFWKTTANNYVLNETIGALWWSYQQLDPDIRHCFAYCSTFPKGYKFERGQLVRIWIAQGFVNKRNDATEELEDVGNRYFDELLTFSFLMQGQRRTIIGTEVFTIHDLLHELAERVAGSDFHRVDLNGSPKDIPPAVRHVFIETNNGAGIAENYLELGSLRTLIIKDHRTCTEDIKQPVEFIMKINHDLEKVFEHLFTRLRKLRVLIIEIKIETDVFSVSPSNDEDHKRHLYFPFPASIDQMKQLRYLGFHYPMRLGHLVLPSSFSKLYHMQTIEASPGSSRVTCPQDMSNLIHLRHISVYLFFPNVSRLTSLQTLAYFPVKKEQGYELKQLKHLNKIRGTLEIRGLGIVESKAEALEANLAQKKRITKMVLSFEGCRARDPDIVADVFEGLWPPKDLVELTIMHYNCSSRYPSWMLSREHPDAPNRLQKLVLEWCSQRLASIPEDSEVFIHLLELRIAHCDWDSLPENMENLVSLQNLEIVGCDKVEVLPTLPQSLYRITLVGCDGIKVFPTLPQSLHRIHLHGCEELEVLPMLPQSLDQITLFGCLRMEVLPTLPKSLRKIEISMCGELSRTCEQEGHENWHKIQHILEKLIF